MKVALISTYDTFQGAARATYRLHQGLRKEGIDSYLLVNKKFSDDPFVIAPNSTIGMTIAQTRARIDQFPLNFYPQRPATYFSPQAVPDGLAKRIQSLQPNVINIHWTQAGFLRIESLAKFQLPIVLTLHDMWALTGGCHYTDGCDRYQKQCGQCPQLGSHQQKDLSQRIWQRKAKAWQNLNLTVVTPSQWLATCVKKSPLLQCYPVKVIANGLDLNQYKPLDKAIAKALLDIPQDRFVLAFGAMGATTDRRKGFFLLKEAIAQLSQTEWQEKIQLLIFGNNPRANVPDFELPTRYLGQLGDDLSLRIIYAAANVMIVPSIQESFGQTASESLACGTPVVAFNATGLKDIIEHQQNGYLAQPYKIENLAYGISWVLEESERYQQLCARAREKVKEEFTVEIQAFKYLQLYDEILESSQ